LEWLRLGARHGANLYTINCTLHQSDAELEAGHVVGFLNTVPSVLAFDDAIDFIICLESCGIQPSETPLFERISNAAPPPSFLGALVYRAWRRNRSVIQHAIFRVMSCAPYLFSEDVIRWLWKQPRWQPTSLVEVTKSYMSSPGAISDVLEARLAHEHFDGIPNTILAGVRLLGEGPQEHRLAGWIKNASREVPTPQIVSALVAGAVCLTPEGGLAVVKAVLDRAKLPEDASSGAEQLRWNLAHILALSGVGARACCDLLNRAEPMRSIAATAAALMLGMSHPQVREGLLRKAGVALTHESNARLCAVMRNLLARSVDLPDDVSKFVQGLGG
jgi:hypothetical protein